MKKYLFSATCFIALSALCGSVLKAQNNNTMVQSTALKNQPSVEADGILKGAVEDVSQRTAYSSVYKTSGGKIIIHYSSRIINRVDALGNSLVTGPTSYWQGGTTSSCLYPNYHTDSIQITVPAGIAISSFIITYAYQTNGNVPIPLSDGVFYFSTPCGMTDTLSCGGNVPGTCYLDVNEDFSPTLTPCIVPSCNNAQSFWLDAHLARLSGGAGCDTNYVWYTAYPLDSLYIFSAYVEGYPALSLLKNSSTQNGPCNGTAKVTPYGGTAPYTYLWSPNNETTDSIGGLCAGVYYCSVTDSGKCMDTVGFIINNTTGISTISKASDITIYPDPNDGNFIITGTTPGQVVTIYDYSGQKLNSALADNATMHMDISDKANGVYLVRILNKDGSLALEKKVMKTQ